MMRTGNASVSNAGSPIVGDLKLSRMLKSLSASIRRRDVSDSFNGYRKGWFLSSRQRSLDVSGTSGNWPEISLRATAYRVAQMQRENVMPDRSASRNYKLDLKAGEWAEVRSEAEILATLDEHGRLENLPFMPEMTQYRGKRFRVYKRADKTCEYTRGWSIRRMKDSVLLEGLRCDGSGHDGCQACCLIFWKEAWLKRVDNSVVSVESLRQANPVPTSSVGGLCTVENILAASKRMNEEGEPIYVCQATDVPKYTSNMRVWDPRQYIRDLRSGNLDSGFADRSREQRALDLILASARLLQAVIIGFFNEIQERRHRNRYPFIEGTADKSPVEVLNLQPGELVEVRSKEEIMATLRKDQKNRGLWFDAEMLPYCGGIYRVLRRVHRIVDEKTGKLLDLKNPCIILDGVVCKSEFHWLCPRAIYPYWRESWLKRAVNLEATPGVEDTVSTYERS
jgi:hypothetical protein